MVDSQMRCLARRASSHSYRARLSPTHPAHEEWWQVRNDYAQMIRKTKCEHWTRWIEELSDPEVWDAHRLISTPSSDGGRTRIPNLRDPQAQEARNRNTLTNAHKSQVLHHTFF